ncbi:MAG: MBL fold metallo-hydrolase [Lachnospiraceae bacterium]|nr:MBL fold metallo-hydrolase [Lachnospiraceae bacterium]
MQTILNRAIDEVRYYSCGYCVNDMRFIVKDRAVKKKEFPAGVFLLHHKKYGYILFDTGYSDMNYKCGIKGKLYNFFNPLKVKKEEEIAVQLQKDGIKPADVKYIILSHLHPDHIGDLRDFPKSKIICSMKCFRQYKKGNIKDLIFTDLLPWDFEKRLYRVRKYDYPTEFFKGYDLFRDGSVILTDISGHAKGQIGAYLPEHEIFLGADAAWGLNLMSKADEMSPPARLVQNNFREYKRSISLLQKLNEAGIKIYLSHDVIYKKDLLNE